MFDRQHIALPRVDATRSGTSYEPPSRYTRPRAAPEARPASPVSERAQAAAVQIDQLERELRPPCAFGKPGDSWKAGVHTCTSSPGLESLLILSSSFVAASQTPTRSSK